MSEDIFQLPENEKEKVELDSDLLVKPNEPNDSQNTVTEGERKIVENPEKVLPFILADPKKSKKKRGRPSKKIKDIAKDLENNNPQSESAISAIPLATTTETPPETTEVYESPETQVVDTRCDPNNLNTKFALVEELVNLEKQVYGESVSYRLFTKMDEVDVNTITSMISERKATLHRMKCKNAVKTTIGMTGTILEFASSQLYVDESGDHYLEGFSEAINFCLENPEADQPMIEIGEKYNLFSANLFGPELKLAFILGSGIGSFVMAKQRLKYEKMQQLLHKEQMAKRRFQQEQENERVKIVSENSASSSSAEKENDDNDFQ